MAKSKKEKSLEQRLDEALVRENEWPYKVPENWVWVKLEYIAQWGSGGTPSRNKKEYYNGTIKWIKTGELKNEIIFDTEEKITESGLKKSSAKLFPKNSVAVAMYGATIGQIGILGVEAATNQACAVAIPHKDILDHVYLFYYLISEKDNFIKLGKGGAQPNISQTIIKNYKSPLPPFGEQNRIVRKLSSMLAKLKEARELVQEAKDSFENRRATILNKAFTGELTKKWRDENPTDEMSVENIFSKIIKNKINSTRHSKKKTQLDLKLSRDEIPYTIPDSWKWSKFESACKAIKDGTHFSPKNQYNEPGKDRYLYLTSKNIRDYGLDLKNVRYIDGKTHNDIFLRCDPELGDILLVKDGAKTGTVTINTIDEEFSLLSSVAVLKVFKKTILPKFIEYFIKSPKGKNIIFAKIAGSAITRITLTKINKFPLPIAPYEEQKEIVRVLDKVFENEFNVNLLLDMKNQIDLIEKSILSKAFRGELDTNDLNDEPAIKLLEKALQSKKLIPAKTKTRRKGITGRQIISTSLDEFSENAQALLKDIKRLFGNTDFNAEKLRDKSNLPYEDFKNSLFELLESKLTMEFDENEEVIRYQLKK